MAYHRELLIASTVALATTLSACGGGGGTAFIPPGPGSPSSPQAQQPAIVTAATTSQAFATRGAAYASPSGSYGDFTVSSPDLAANAQLDARYNAATKRYEVRLPDNPAWRTISQIAAYPPPADFYQYSSSGTNVVGLFDYRHGLEYSALLEWYTGTDSGYAAIGIATLPAGIPTTGSASYDGWLLGSSSETFVVGFEQVTVPVPIEGTITLDFDFGSGALSGNIDPTIGGNAMPTLAFTNTVYSVGSTTFSGQFTTALPGMNSFSGLFTGPSAEELIGNFAFPYQSVVDASNQQAAGAFVANRP